MLYISASDEYSDVFCTLLTDKIFYCVTVLQQTYAQWRKVFGIIAAVYAGGAIIYTVFGTGKLQPWNSVPKKTESDKNELDKNELETEEKIPLRNNNV
jgi:hypothetical protein